MTDARQSIDFSPNLDELNSLREQAKAITQRLEAKHKIAQQIKGDIRPAQQTAKALTDWKLRWNNTGSLQEKREAIAEWNNRIELSIG